MEKISQQLIDYIRNSLFAGYPARQVRDSLISQGWPKKIINQYVGKVYQKNKEYLTKVKSSVKIDTELERLKKEIKHPKEGIKYPKPTVIKEPVTKPFVIMPKPIKPTPQTKLLAQELTQIEKELQKPSVPTYQKPTTTKTLKPSKDSIEKLKETISVLSRQSKTKDEIVQKLVKENWPEEFLHHFIKKYFPHLQNVSFFKKEVTALEQTLKKLKPGDKK